MNSSPRPLTFAAVDELAFAAARGLLSKTADVRYAPRRLGPLMELFCLLNDGAISSPASGKWIVPNGSQQFLDAIENRRERWLSPDNKRLGFIRARRTGANADAHLTAFLMDAQRAARDVAGLPGTTPGQMAAAMEELENNIHEHSDSPETGLIAFRAARGVFEFVAADRGIGMLASLKRSPTYATLPDHGKALEAALSDGSSRFGNNSGRGHGFRPIFLGLVNLQGSLRFRSGDHALLMDGTSPNLNTAQLAQKAPMVGFFASVRCQMGDLAKRKVLTEKDPNSHPR